MNKIIHIIITSFNEPKATVRAVQAFLNQRIKDKFKIIVVDPFPEVEEYVLKKVKSKNVEFFLDPGEGKGYALNLLFEQIYSNNTNDIIVLSDGDVYVSNNAVEEILKRFENPKIGCVTGRPVSVDSNNNKYGVWSKIAFAGINKVRKRFDREKKFFECSGYLFAIRNGIMTSFPSKTSEDSIIPYIFWKKGYKIGYVDKAEVYVKNPGNWKDWLNQKVRNVKAHENLNKIAPSMPRTKSLSNEIREGLFFAISQPRNVKELLWTLQLYPARLYLYLKAFKELKEKRTYNDGWREVEINSTKPLD